MPVKLRLQRHGKKNKPFYHIVAADARAPRDGKFIERIGSYNPNTNPATIDVDVDSALKWLANGAQPTDTARAILSYKGVMFKKHLLRGVAKGSFTAEVAEEKWATWMAEKDAQIQAKVDKLSNAEKAAFEKQLANEISVNKERAAAIVAKNTPEVVEEAVADTAEEATEEAAPEADATEETEA
jgi:small subunit ribosomal protein S16